MASDARIVSGGQNEGPITALHVRSLSGKTNAIPVFLVNISGDTYNAGGGGSGGNVNLTQINGVTPSVNSGTSDNGTLRVVVASDQTVPVSFLGGVQTLPPVTGVQLVGGWSGQVAPSGDFPVRIAVINAPIGITGDVSTIPKVGQTWPVREQGVVGVQLIGGGVNRVSISGDTLAVSQQGAYATSITGDVLLRANPNTIIGQLGGTLGVNILGGSVGGRVSISGDQLNTSQQGVVGVYIVGGSGQGTAGISGDVAIKPSTATGIGRFPVSGDTVLRDGVSNIRATVLSLNNSNPLTVSIAGPSGEQYPNRSSAANYGRKNITTSATKILSSNPNRLALLIQNLENQQAIIGFSPEVTVIAPGGFLSPISGAAGSGDGGVYNNSDYTGEVWGIVASGDLDVAYQEFVK